MEVLQSLRLVKIDGGDYGGTKLYKIKLRVEQRDDSERE